MAARRLSAFGQFYLRQGRWEHIMASWLRYVDGKLCCGRILLAVTLLGVSLNAAVPARADDGPTKRNPASASAVRHIAGDNRSSETMYTVTYAVADILSQIQDERRLNAKDAKEFLRNRVRDFRGHTR
jgi:hypothetical protein